MKELFLDMIYNFIIILDLPKLASGNCLMQLLVVSYCAERHKRRQLQRLPEDHVDLPHLPGNVDIVLKT